jgi:hypothetical protein
LSALTLHRTPPAPLLQLGGGSKAKQLRSAVELAPALTEEAASKLASEDPPQLGRGGRGASATPVSESPATLGASPRGVYTHMHTHLCTHRALLHTCGVWREAGGGTLVGLVCGGAQADALSLACCWLAGRHVPDGLVGQPAHRGLCQPGLHGSSRVRAHCSARCPWGDVRWCVWGGYHPCPHAPQAAYLTSPFPGTPWQVRGLRH